MDLFFKITAGALVSVIVGLSMGRDFSALLSLAVCVMGIGAMLRFIQPVWELFREFQDLAGMSGEMGNILFKVLGIGLITELACMLCSDTGNAVLGRMLKMVSSFLILWLAVPLLRSVLSMLRALLGAV